MTVIRFLEDVDNLLDKDHWTKGTEARNKDGIEVNPRNEEAVRFCLIGACERIDGDFQKAGMTFLSVACKELYNTPYLFSVNDNVGFKAVKKAIARAKELAH